MALVTKVDVSIDLQNPVSEVVDVINLVISMYPGRGLEILKKIDDEIGLALAKAETKPEESIPNEDLGPEGA